MNINDLKNEREIKIYVAGLKDALKIGNNSVKKRIEYGLAIIDTLKAVDAVKKERLDRLCPISS